MSVDADPESIERRDFVDHLEIETKRRLQEKTQAALRDKLTAAIEARSVGDREDYHAEIQVAYNLVIDGLADINQYSTELAEPLYGLRDYRSSDRRADIDRVLDELLSIAALHDIVPRQIAKTSKLMGEATQVGEVNAWNVDWNPVLHESVMKHGKDPEVTCIQGRTGFGKSTYLETLALDRYYSGRKILDVADFDEGENCLYDVPQTDDDLRQIRDEMGLPVDWRDTSDLDRPNIEILHPLSLGLEESAVPYDIDGEEFRVKPFTIPASDLNMQMLDTLTGNTTTTQQNFLEDAYESLRGDDNWTLKDLSDRVFEYADNEKVAERIHSTLRTLQRRGFIRDSQDDHVLDWQRILMDRDTITVITTYKMQEKAYQYMVAAYLMSSILEQRMALKETLSHPDGRNDLMDRLDGAGVSYQVGGHGAPKPPGITLCMRELHRLCPKEGQEHPNDTIRSLQHATIEEFEDLVSVHRHRNIELLTDTQYFKGDIKKSVREDVDRIISFKRYFNEMKQTFKEKIGAEGRKQYIRTIANEYEEGDCAIIGGRAIPKSFLMTVNAAPPMNHHHVATSDLDGLQERELYLDEEQMREAPWNSTSPERMRFEDMDEESDRPLNQVEEFVEECLMIDKHHVMPKWEAEWAYRAWCRANEEEPLPERKFKRKFVNARPIEDPLVSQSQGYHFNERYDVRAPEYRHVRLNNRGVELMEQWVSMKEVDPEPSRPPEPPNFG